MSPSDSASSPATLPRRPSRRVHSDAQLIRKRQVDRLKQKANRDENKKRMEKLEGDMAQLLAKVDGMNQHLALYLGTATAPPALSPGPLQSEEGDRLASPQRAHHTTTQKQESSRPDACGQQEIPILVPLTTMAARCRCGVKHRNMTECLEYSGFTMLYKAHVGIAQDPDRVPPRLPLNPPLANMLLLSTEGSSVAFFASTILRQFAIYDTATLLGLYLVAYRFLRWRLYPDAASLEGVPEWLRPTAVQEAHVHPLCIDYIPWPALRDYLCLNKHHDRRHSVALYIQSLRLAWPPQQPLFLTDQTEGGVVLNPCFPALATEIGNWDLGSPWADEFPELVNFVKP